MCLVSSSPLSSYCPPPLVKPPFSPLHIGVAPDILQWCSASATSGVTRSEIADDESHAARAHALSFAFFHRHLHHPPHSSTPSLTPIDTPSKYAPRLDSITAATPAHRPLNNLSARSCPHRRHSPSHPDFYRRAPEQRVTLPTDTSRPSLPCGDKHYNAIY